MSPNRCNNISTKILLTMSVYRDGEATDDCKANIYCSFIPEVYGGKMLHIIFQI